MFLDPSVRLYLENPQQMEFDATIVARRELPAGGIGVVLDRTCFYPTSGGQPHDTGTLNDVAVLEVLEEADGCIVHRLVRDPGGPRLRGRIDAARRRDHMQQHSGQHLLSATVLALFERQTLSFHLGGERCSIDVPGEPLAPEELERLEQRTNELVWEGRPVRARFVEATQLDPLRKAPPAGLDRVRVVEIDGWDANACCGTHVQSTNEIGLVKLLGQERVGRGTRLHFVCGARALAEAAHAQRRLDDLVRVFTCHPDALLEKCSRLLEETRTLRKERDRTLADLAAAGAASWLAAAPRAGGVPVVARDLESGGAVALRAAVEAVVAGGGVALLAAHDERVQLLFMRPDRVALDLRPVLQAACARLRGRGGGQPSRVQGSAEDAADLPGALAAARDAVLQLLDAAAAGF